MLRKQCWGPLKPKIKNRNRKHESPHAKPQRQQGAVVRVQCFTTLHLDGPQLLSQRRKMNLRVQRQNDAKLSMLEDRCSESVKAPKGRATRAH